ncbi:hypothetical protein Slala05_22250 [Streptomyces lavendulae subsp. lavendulae]|nr:hypothetical protein Slala05_22250 [Streptomyces lavendulae subsp. lavendulae]
MPAQGHALSTAIRWISETFGSYKARPAAAVCLGNYSDFLLSETPEPPEGPSQGLRFQPLSALSSLIRALTARVDANSAVVTYPTRLTGP